MKKIISLTVLSLLIGGCAITTPYPVDTEQTKDKEMACSDILYEYETNTTQAAEKISDNQLADVGGFFFAICVFPVWDTGNADGHEGNALLDRNIWLKKIAVDLDCDISSYPKQPKRY